MDSSQIIGIIIASVSIVGGMVLAMIVVKITVPKHYEERKLMMENQNKERLALIEKGIDPSIVFKKEKRTSNDPLFWGLLLMGIGFGAFCGSVVWYNYQLASQRDMTNASALFFGGIGLILYYITRRRSDRKKAQ